MSVIIYQDHIEFLEAENLLLQQEVLFLRQQLQYKSLGNLDTENDDVELEY